jgi:hypothetical protein
VILLPRGGDKAATSGSITPPLAIAKSWPVMLPADSPATSCRKAVHRTPGRMLFTLMP